MDSRELPSPRLPPEQWFGAVADEKQVETPKGYRNISVSDDIRHLPGIHKEKKCLSHPTYAHLRYSLVEGFQWVGIRRLK